LDVLDALPQLVEDRSDSFDERLAVGRWLDALPAAIEQPDTHRPLQLGNGVRNRGLGHVKALGRPANALHLDDNQQNVELAQFKAAAEMTVPLHDGPSHSETVMRSSDIKIIFV